jgi:type IV pilus assembly protein PilM
MDIGNQNIHLIQGKFNKSSISVRDAIECPIPEGVFQDGRIEDLEALRQIIRRCLTSNKIKGKNAVITTQSTSVITRDILLPVADRKQLDSMVKYEIEQYLPIVASEYVVEYSVAEEVIDDGISKYKVQVAAMPKNMVENFANLLSECGLKTVALDLHFNAVAKLFSQKLAINGETFNPDKTIAFIDLGHHSITIHILHNTKLAFSRIINLGSKEIDSEIALAFSLSLEDSEKKKIKEADLDPDGFNEYLSDKCNDIIRSRVDTWLSEIQKMFQYYISRTTGNRIDGIYLLGGASGLKGLSKYVEQALNLKTQTIDKIDIIKPGKTSGELNPRSYINALGGLIRYE